MCGFVSVYHKYGQPVQPEEIERMADQIHHRGPDDTHFYVEDHIGFGFKRLSIIDLAHGRQPLCNEDGTIWIVFNGEIYNYKELQQWLKDKGHQFKTNSDTETIVHLYEEVGFDTPKYLRGMFAFTIWDLNKQQYFGARDHFGIKPLYYTETARGFHFASEIKCLLELEDLSPDVNTSALYQYLTFQYNPYTETFFKGIHKVLPGHCFLIRNDRLDIRPYWQVHFDPDESKPLSYYIDQTRAIMENSIQYHRQADVPLGAFLSSGVDSSTTAGLLRNHGPLKTFSIGFALGQNELPYARRTAEHFGTEHYELEVTPQMFIDELPQIIWHMDEPLADPAAIPLYFVSKLARDYVTVVLSGEGADEFFGGYGIYREPNALRPFNYMPKGLRKMLGSIASNLPNVKGKNYIIRGSKDLQERFFGNAFIFSEEMKREVLTSWVNQQTQHLHPLDITLPIYENASMYDDVTKMQYLDIHTWLPGDILLKADKMSMANSLELRVPFLDKEVFEVASKIPTKYKIAGGTTKFVLREAMKDLLPKEIHMRPKLGFPVPTRHWLKNEFYLWAMEILSTSQIDQYINKRMAIQLLSDHKEGKADYSRRIWTILCFALWHQIYIEKQALHLLNNVTISKIS
ncbi:asparagine synthase (glutamine-hydrolyzing) [Thermoflavimicrobium daqui]|uniref:asparagine synthase (glutamine-hydrolyzing) n=1 Tax=Thermoflavimicrobium daqui TaxID=2137476 RepID=A0A364K9U1_9BACL|nr:asparagine synthase (glutamine-hydrolyzing) [Thermoflavimicrobium daqui]RAL26970.1 asparagine synthase (glutamine-hydrolyzing) [Thermoflavimicrobium daqui]